MLYADPMVFLCHALARLFNQHAAVNSAFKMLLRKGFLTPGRIKLMKSWEHSGFNVNAAVRIGAGDATGLENLPWIE